ncbi:MAG: tRNA (adenosine(37)-N6)-threonylcarbamoyltransferase complex ATPase subunit type 1 TsaE [Longimicrobiales bacterium]|nr:tRNA (adenosine(37)-N6)-threonylcarbamoyltransferase complex ATPase subunit type 1 TsaE [Longimicrobiales bacterium]
MRLDEAGLVRWGERIGETLDAPAFIGLQGPLGAGKSVLARAIGQGLGVSQPMPSPSFNLQFRYSATLGVQVVHMDLYRLAGSDELAELGWDDLGQPNEVILVEWPERAGSLVPPDHWIIELSPVRARPLLRDVGVIRAGHPPELAGFPMTVAGGPAGTIPPGIR